jgi:hypothetical protein
MSAWYFPPHGSARVASQPAISTGVLGASLGQRPGDEHDACEEEVPPPHAGIPATATRTKSKRSKATMIFFGGVLQSDAAEAGRNLARSGLSFRFDSEGRDLGASLN